MNRRAFFTIALSLPLTGYGFIYEAKVMRVWNKTLNKYQNFIGLSDFHDKTHISTQDQLTRLKQLLVRCNPATTKIILEDLSSKGSGGRIACGNFVVNSRGGILGGLAEFCLQKKLQVDNVEYRYCRVSSLGPILNNLQQHMSNVPSANSISVAALLKEIQDIVDEVTTYKDHPLLMHHYKKGIQEVTQELKKLRLASDQQSVAHYLSVHAAGAQRLEVIKRLLTFDSGLLDLKLLHSIANAGQEHIIAIAGGSHIARITEILSKMGYETMYQTTVNYHREYALQKCVGSTITEDQWCMRPHPIDLLLLDPYI